MKKVSIVCNWLFNEADLSLTKGGSQRYVLELTKLLLSLDYEVRIFQKSSITFHTKLFNNVDVFGVKTAINTFGTMEFSFKVSRLISNQELSIYVYQESSFPFVKRKSIAIQHGINWSGNELIRKFFNTYIVQPFLLKRLVKIICVDTAYINWVTTQLNINKFDRNKLEYIPNFVDVKKHFSKAKWTDIDADQIILFPRRMVNHRGALLAYEAMKILWCKGKKYTINFCGYGPLSEIIMKDAEINGFIKFIKLYEKDFDEMPLEYARSHLAIIPTLLYEGTSLSCIESMASGLPVITTNIGGLCNLVIPNFNGSCINANAHDLAAEIEYILSSQKIWECYSKNGVLTGEKLDIHYWRKKWTKILIEYENCNIY